MATSTHSPGRHGTKKADVVFGWLAGVAPQLAKELDSPSQDWWPSAACRGEDPELFMARRGDLETVQKAKRICAQCKVRIPCLAYALRTKTRVGIWGGLGEKDRRMALQVPVLAERLGRRVGT